MKQQNCSRWLSSYHKDFNQNVILINYLLLDTKTAFSTAFFSVDDYWPKLMIGVIRNLSRRDEKFDAD